MKRLVRGLLRAGLVFALVLVLALSLLYRYAPGDPVFAVVHDTAAPTPQRAAP